MTLKFKRGCTRAALLLPVAPGGEACAGRRPHHSPGPVVEQLLALALLRAAGALNSIHSLWALVQ